MPDSNRRLRSEAPRGADRAALAALETATVLGAYKVAPESGVQIGAKPAVVQIRKGRAQVVWPPAFETAKPLLPYPQWNERSLLR